MNDREALQTVENSLEAMLDLVRAQLATNVIPKPVEPPAVVPVNPISRNPFLDAYAQSNPGTTTTVTTPGGPPPANIDYLESSDYDIHALNGPRRYSNGNNVHFITPNRDCTLILHIGKMPGNDTDNVRLNVWGGGASEELDIPTTDQVIAVKFTAKAGTRYGISISSPKTFALEIMAELQ